MSFKEKAIGFFDWDHDGQSFEFFDWNNNGRPFEWYPWAQHGPVGGLLDAITNYNKSHESDNSFNSSASQAGNINDNNDFMDYLSGLLASQGQEAVENRLYNSEEAQKAREFSSSEAEKNRAWQEEMSNTSYQRAVADLQAAGLNPILAYSQGGASTPSGSSASPSSASSAAAGGDTLSSVMNAFANLISSGTQAAALIGDNFDLIGQAKDKLSLFSGLLDSPNFFGVD